ncbi:hypothetical protein ACP70R_003572 [Stipagrostis hirtigluma subsp. patula]
MAPSWTVSFQRFVQRFLTGCRRVSEEKTDSDDEPTINHGDSKPPHLLGLLKFIITSGMAPKKCRKSKFSVGSWALICSSAVDLAQIGVKLTASTAGGFPDMEVQRKLVFGELSLSPLLLHDVAACCLVNLAALEAAEATNASSWESDGYVVSSYLSVLAMLMDREEDVQQLRERGLLRSHFSNTQTLAFFKGLGQHLRLGYNYFAVVKEIDEYMRRRPVRVAVHKFLYSYFKLIAAVLSIASVLVGIFKALYSLKKP